MMDLTVKGLHIRDEDRLAIGGRTVDRFKLVTFYLGEHGPFTERLPADATAADINARIEAVRATLRSITT